LEVTIAAITSKWAISSGGDKGTGILTLYMRLY